MQLAMSQLLPVITDFVHEKAGIADAMITPETKLLQDGYLDSFALVELIGCLEKKLNIVIPTGSVIPDDFETPGVLLGRLSEM